MGTGIAGSDLTEEQKQLLLDVIANRVGLADVAGYTTSGWGHIHTIYRDTTNDYVNSVTQQEASGMGGGGAPAGSMGTPPNGG